MRLICKFNISFSTAHLHERYLRYEYVNNNLRSTFHLSRRRCGTKKKPISSCFFYYEESLNVFEQSSILLTRSVRINTWYCLLRRSVINDRVLKWTTRALISLNQTKVPLQRRTWFSLYYTQSLSFLELSEMASS